MKALLSLLVTSILTLVLLDFGVFEQPRFGIPEFLARLNVPFLSDLAQHIINRSLFVSTVGIIMGLYGLVRAIFGLLPRDWFGLKKLEPIRLPDPRLYQDRVATLDPNPWWKRRLQNPSSWWNFALALILVFFLIMAGPVIVFNPTYYWVWGLSLVVPLALAFCFEMPDKPVEAIMTDEKLDEHLTPRYFSNRPKASFTKRAKQRARKTWSSLKRKSATIIRNRRARAKSRSVAPIPGPRTMPPVSPLFEPELITATPSSAQLEPARAQPSDMLTTVRQWAASVKLAGTNRVRFLIRRRKPDETGAEHTGENPTAPPPPGSFEPAAKDESLGTGQPAPHSANEPS